LIVCDNYGRRYGKDPDEARNKPHELIYSLMLMDEEKGNFEKQFEINYRKYQVNA